MNPLKLRKDTLRVLASKDVERVAGGGGVVAQMMPIEGGTVGTIECYTASCGQATACRGLTCGQGIC